MNKKGMGIVGVCLGILLGFIIICLIVVGVPIEDNNGSQVGYITTVETNGVIFKTDSAYIKSNLESSQEERYCINQEVKEDLINAMNNNSKVRIYFNDVFIRKIGLCKESDLDIIYKVEMIN
jgi:hypothetical protein